MRRLGAALALLAACSGRGCREEEPAPDLAEVSEQAQFATVEQLGPHHLLATINRKEYRDDELVSSASETLDIRWQDWDHFLLRRLVDGDIVYAVRVVDGRAWLRRGVRRWDAKDDAEPYRLQLRTTWNAWDEALELFRDRIAYKDLGTGVVEGRPARRYAVSLAPAEPVPEKRAKRRASEGGPTALAGTLWVDEATSVRLQAEVMGTWVRGGTRKEITLRLNRSGIGEPQRIRAPGPRKGGKAGRRRKKRRGAAGRAPSPSKEP